MKFGSLLQDAVYPEWQAAYMDYDGLKKRLRKVEKDKPFTEKDETEFVEMLDDNLEKVYAFHQEKMNEIRTRTDHWAEQIASQMPGQDSVAEMASIQENINAIADDINRLSRFSRINYTGFLKIVKKHDRHTDYVLKPMLIVRLNQCPFWNEDYDTLLIKLSEMFSQVRDGGKTMSFKASSKLMMDPVNTSREGRKTVVNRFFVQTDNVFELKTYVLRHLPVLVYRDNSIKQDNIDPPISSLYLDNADLEAYTSRVETAQGSQIIRLRWYGSANGNSSIACERRTLSDEPYGEIKDRFVIKDKYVAGFLAGEQTFVEKAVKKMRNMSGKTEEEVEKFKELVQEIQHTILEKKMQPVLRTYYKRTAFQIPGDKSVRMALDTDLCFIREDSKLFPDDKTVRRPDGAWRRADVDTNFPFNDLNEGRDINRYPFATFEIKMELSAGEKVPEWISDLQESGILEEAFDFTKLVHGIAVMFDTRVALLPYWLAQMSDDYNELPILPSQTPSVAKRLPKNLFAYDEDDTDSYQASAVAREEPTERSSLLQSNQPSTSYTGTPSYEPSPAQEQPHWLSQASSYLTQSCFNIMRFGKPPISPSAEQREPVVFPPGVKVPKKVITPLRVEPKVFFANERTYFSWMSFGTLLATFSIALFNAGDAVGKVSGIVYTLISLSTLLYGMGLYYRRRELIRAKASGPYDDLAGPTVICFALVFAVGLNAYLKFTVKSPSVLYF